VSELLPGHQRARLRTSIDVRSLELLLAATTAEERLLIIAACLRDTTEEEWRAAGVPLPEPTLSRSSSRIRAFNDSGLRSSRRQGSRLK